MGDNLFHNSVAVEIGGEGTPPKLSPEELEKIEAENEAIYEEAMYEMKILKNRLIIQHPFFGILASQLVVKVTKTDDPFIRTAATDYQTVYFNPAFMLGLNQDHRLFVYAHEIGHIILMSKERMGTRDPKIWNFATDYAINALLLDAGFSMPTIANLDAASRKRLEELRAQGFKTPSDDAPMCLYDAKYDGWTAEAIYNDLLEKSDSEISNLQTLDQHIFSGMGDKGEGDKEGGEGNTGIGGGPGVGQGYGQVEDHIRNLWKDRITQAAMQSRQAGTLPAGMERYLADLHEAKINWRQFIRAKFTSSRASDYEWNPPDLEMFGQGVTLPQINVQDCLRAAAIIDASGSVTDEDMVDIMSEIVGVARQFSAYELLVFSFDGEVHNPVMFTEQDDVAEYKVRGGGGTLFKSAFDYLDGKTPIEGETNSFKPDVVLFFTDGYPCDGWQEEFADKYDVVWFITVPDDVKAPWGTTVKYDRYV